MPEFTPPRPGSRRGPGRRRPAHEPARRGDGGADAGPAAGLIAGRGRLRLPDGAARTPGRGAPLGTMRDSTAPQPRIYARRRGTATGSGSAPPPTCSPSRRPPRTGPAPSSARIGPKRRRRCCRGWCRAGGRAGREAGRLRLPVFSQRIDDAGNGADCESRASRCARFQVSSFSAPLTSPCQDHFGMCNPCGTSCAAWW
jgi:hypothetical protein